ncbi:MAG: hypothetical protein HYY30_05870 [Chloroflexi bacterium]|nr:hypothetical protein [Chloroflexota bacterium]
MAYRFDGSAPEKDPDVSDVGSGAIFIITVLLLFAVAVTLFWGSGFVISAVASNPMFNILTSKSELPTSIAKPNVQLSLAEPTPTVEPTPVPEPTPVFVTIANTGGDGVFLRRTPRSADRLVAWMDGTVLEIVGEDREAEGMVWRNVKDSKGNIGWVPAKYVTENAP